MADTGLVAYRVISKGEGDRLICLGRIVTPNGTVLLQGGAGDAVVTNVSLAVFDLDINTPEIPIYQPATLTTAATFKAALTVDGSWDQDATGFNFAFTLLPTDFQQYGGHRLSIEFTVNSANFGNLAADFPHSIKRRYAA